MFTDSNFVANRKFWDRFVFCLIIIFLSSYIVIVGCHVVTINKFSLSFLKNLSIFEKLMLLVLYSSAFLLYKIGAHVTKNTPRGLQKKNIKTFLKIASARLLLAIPLILCVGSI